jgi:hypothetical protein
MSVSWVPGSRGCPPPSSPPGDAAALSSVRVMGPCAAMGAGAAHALDLAGSGSTHDVDPDQLHERLAPNLD